METTYNLNEVFGISNRVPPTYVTREHLDDDFKNALQEDKLIFICGASKQGKTLLRKMHLPEDKAIVVHCRADMTTDQFFKEISWKLDDKANEDRQRVSRITETTRNQDGISGQVAAGINLPVLVNIGGKADKSIMNATETVVEYEQVPEDHATLLNFVSRRLKGGEIRCVIEDFHYLPQDEAFRKALAHDFKMLWDNGVYLIIVGIWPQMTAYISANSDLRHRCMELNVQWTNNELEKVLSLGEEALGVEIDPDIKRAMVRDALGNVGLLQILAQRFCRESGISGTQHPNKVTVAGPEATDALNRAREKTCDDYAGTYRNFVRDALRGFRDRETGLAVANKVMQVVLAASAEESLKGLAKETIEQRVKKKFFLNANKNVRNAVSGQVTHALNTLNERQAAMGYSPLVYAYDPDRMILELLDREFIFYRNYKVRPHI